MTDTKETPKTVKLYVRRFRDDLSVWEVPLKVDLKEPERLAMKIAQLRNGIQHCLARGETVDKVDLCPMLHYMDDIEATKVCNSLRPPAPRPGPQLARPAGMA